MRALALSVTSVLAVSACHTPTLRETAKAQATAPVHTSPDDPAAPDPDGPHRAEIAAQIQPFLDADIASSIVVGIDDGGKREIYGFGHGTTGTAPPNGRSIYEIGSVTKAYTSLLLADAIQKKELDLDTPLSDLLPPGVTAPTKDKVAITLSHLALHTSGLPPVPATLMRPSPSDPYADYTEDLLYKDLVQTELQSTPGERVTYSNFGSGLLGFVVGKKLAGNYATAVTSRVIKPLGLTSTFVSLPPAEKARRVPGTDEDLHPVPPWTFDALAAAGAINSDARDQLALVDAELDAAAGGTTALRRAMKLTQEPQLEVPDGSPNEGLGWQIDRSGRYWHNGATGGYHAFVGFDTRTHRGVVILASTQSSLIDHIADALYAVMDGSAKPPAKLATTADIADYAGNYDFSGEPLALVAAGNRLHIEGRGEPPHRLVPISDHEFWIEALSAVAVFERDITTHAVTKLVFVMGDKQLVATRIAAPKPPPS